MITLCEYQYKKRSFFTSFYGKKTIPITVDPKFLNVEIDTNYLPERKVVYNIRSNRNLDRLIKIWCEKIFPINNEFKLFITPDLIKYSDYHKNNNNLSKSTLSIFLECSFITPMVRACRIPFSLIFLIAPIEGARNLAS